MDRVRDFEDDRFSAGSGSGTGGAHGDEAGMDAGTAPAAPPAPAIGNDERRMHVRAYNHWVSLLKGRAYPSIEDLDPANIADFGPHSVLLDFTVGIADPAIAFLGKSLREECQLDYGATHISNVPSRSLLSRLTDHYLQIIANRAPIGFEAEFVSMRGHNTMYRGILMPFSSDGDTIDFIYGVINWKELVDPETQARLEAEVAEAARQNAVSAAARPAPAAVAPIWADGPSAGFDAGFDSATNSGTNMRAEPDFGEDVANDDRADDAIGTGTLLAGSLADQLMLAQQTAAAVRAADTRSRAALYRALGRAHDFALAADADPQGYAALLTQAGIAVQLRAPMTPLVKLVFGTDYDKTRLTEFAAVLSHARRTGIGIGALPDLLEATEGGIKAIVKAERALRRPAAAARPVDAAAVIAARPVLAQVSLGTQAVAGDYVVLLARAGDGDTLDIVAAIGNDQGLTARVIDRAAK